ncbi:Transfer protein [Seminavis robusta]|uniref:Transfer protein n=1 Tax=Seminavis robusta TaxID=568900 RepID=A0A9N8E8X0_9STRA|nr:Transfer protein [Seminavis robusta]|eukprot:Sro638_g179510.1 Transfer protein (574) ;mRNA; r:3407-5298
MSSITAFEPTPVSPEHDPALFSGDAITEDEFAALDSLFGGDEGDDYANYDGDLGGIFDVTDASLFGIVPVSAPDDSDGMGNLVEAMEKAGKPRPKATELIAETLKALPTEERERIVKELYGIANSFPPPNYHADSKSASSMQYIPQDEDDPIFIGQKLEEMEDHLKKYKSSPSWNLRITAIQMAESQNMEYVQNAKFRLKFIRAERYDVRRAAARLIRFFDLKLELFGAEVLTRSITLKDLTAEDRETVKKGYTQRLPVRDRAGRSIFCHVFNGQTYESPESFVRIMWYMSKSDEQSDKRGTINIFFKLKDYKFKNCNRAFGGTLFIGRMMAAAPWRADAMHKFLENENSLDLSTKVMNKLVDYCTAFIVPEIRARTRIHHGTHEDWVKVLMSFGIPADVIPLTYSYKIKTKNHLEYLAMRAKAEEIMERYPGTNQDILIDLPARSDVLLGKGKPIQFSSGNQRLMTIIDSYLDQYHNKCSKHEKTELTAEIVSMLKDSGVRFLCKDSGIWLEVTDDLARGKISYMFRHQRGRTPAKNGISATGVVRQVPSGDENKTDAAALANDSKRVRVGA